MHFFISLYLYTVNYKKLIFKDVIKVILITLERKEF